MTPSQECTFCHEHSRVHTVHSRAQTVPLMFPRDSDHISPPLPGTVTAALVPSRGQTALHRPAPSGVRAGHGPTGHLPIGSGRLGVPVAHLAQADSDPLPVTFQATRITGRTHGSGRLGSQRPVTSHDADHSTASASESVPGLNVELEWPCRSSRNELLLLPAGSSAWDFWTIGLVPLGRARAWAGCIPVPAVLRTLEHSCTGRESHTMAPAVWHTVPSCRMTHWIRTPLVSHRYVSTHSGLRPRLPNNVHIQATSEGASCTKLKKGAGNW
jgi:hypothetical protein